MSLPPKVAESLLVACHRHCCICHKYAGNKMEIHHIIPKAKGGNDTAENGIPLCFDCHAEVNSYNDQHPRGRKFQPSELRKHKTQWFAMCSQSPWRRSSIPAASEVPLIETVDENIFDDLRVDDHEPAQKLVVAIMEQEGPVRNAFADRVFEGLRSEDEETRWKFAYVVEELLIWEPQLVPAHILEEMSQDGFFSVRSAAAVCYYHLAALSPSTVPLRVLSKLAAYDEDWYVTTPATGALLRLARSRPVVVDILARGLDSDDRNAREHAAGAIRRLAARDWDLVPPDVTERMRRSRDPYVRQVGQECWQKIKDGGGEPLLDYSMF